MTNHNGWLETLALLERQEQLLRAKFGDVSLVLSHVLFLKLVFVVQAVVLGEENAAEHLFPILHEYAIFHQGHLTVLGGEESSHHPELNYTSETYAFPSEIYKRDYLEAGQKYRHKIQSSISFSQNTSLLFYKTIYVVGQGEELRWYPEPQATEAILLGRQNTTMYPVHPMLAEDFNLSVALAGEMSFFWLDGQDLPAVVFVNNTSGHYLPIHWTAKQVALYMRRVLALNNSVSIISKGNDGIAISGSIVDKS